jgi:hypothetical protein
VAEKPSSKFSIRLIHGKLQKRILFCHSLKAMQLDGMGERSQKCCTHFICMLIYFYSKTDDKINENEIKDYFLHLKNVDK